MITPLVHHHLALALTCKPFIFTFSTFSVFSFALFSFSALAVSGFASNIRIALSYSVFMYLSANALCCLFCLPLAVLDGNFLQLDFSNIPSFQHIASIYRLVNRSSFPNPWTSSRNSLHSIKELLNFQFPLPPF